jgi:hypothetical protein
VAVVWNEIDSLFPPGNSALLLQVEQTLCQQAVVPVIDSIVAGEETRATGVTSLIQACLKLIDAADFQTSDPLLAFQFALGNLLVCDKISNTVLTEPLTEGRSDVCNAILASAN